jgi:hypothetical protein
VGARHDQSAAKRLPGQGGADGQANRLVRHSHIPAQRRKTAEAFADLYRRRRKIGNEGNQTQKKEYGLEHGFGAKGFAWKNCPLLIQVAQLFNSLARLGDLGERGRRRLPDAAAEAPRKKLWPTLRDFAARLRIAIRGHDPCKMQEAHARLPGTCLRLHLLEAAAEASFRPRPQPHGSQPPTAKTLPPQPGLPPSPMAAPARIPPTPAEKNGQPRPKRGDSSALRRARVHDISIG